MEGEVFARFHSQGFSEPVPDTDRHRFRYYGNVPETATRALCIYACTPHKCNGGTLVLEEMLIKFSSFYSEKNWKSEVGHILCFLVCITTASRILVKKSVHSVTQCQEVCDN